MMNECQFEREPPSTWRALGRRCPPLETVSSCVMKRRPSPCPPSNDFLTIHSKSGGQQPPAKGEQAASETCQRMKKNGDERGLKSYRADARIRVAIRVVVMPSKSVSNGRSPDAGPGTRVKMREIATRQLRMCSGCAQWRCGDWSSDARHCKAVRTAGVGIKTLQSKPRSARSQRRRDAGIQIGVAARNVDAAIICFE
jgi:hypothetical protein